MIANLINSLCRFTQFTIINQITQPKKTNEFHYFILQPLSFAHPLFQSEQKHFILEGCADALLLFFLGGGIFIKLNHKWLRGAKPVWYGRCEEEWQYLRGQQLCVAWYGSKFRNFRTAHPQYVLQGSFALCLGQPKHYQQR